MKNVTFALLLAMLVAGCGPAATNEAKPSPTADSKTGGGETASAEIPAALQHDAYTYNGLDCKDELVYEYIAQKGAEPLEGRQFVEGPEQKDNKALFTVKRSGSLSELGDDEVEVREDGVYLVGGSKSRPAKPSLLMPAKLGEGTEWDTDIELADGPGKVTLKGKNKASAVEKVKVKAGEFDAILVTQDSKLDTSGTKDDVTAKTWYAKGVGVVKMTLELRRADGTIHTSSIELAGRGPKQG
jgi:hypothetical protein